MQGPYDQFLLFGDSITQQSCSQVNGFAFCPALQDGMTRLWSFLIRSIYESCMIGCENKPMLIVDRACQLSLDGWMLSTGAFPYATCHYAQ